MAEDNMSTKNPPPIPNISFDQIVKGNVVIKKLSKHEYKITFNKIGKFLMYQVWDKDDNVNNEKRAVFYVTAKKWVNNFMKLNTFLKESGKPLFTPTTIMETANEVDYAIVIHNAYFDRHNRVVFTVSTKEIQLANNCSKKLINIPSGTFKNMRFDIDEFRQDTICELPKGRSRPRCFLPSQVDFYQYSTWYYIGVSSIPREWGVINEDYYVNADGAPWAYVCDSIPSG